MQGQGGNWRVFPLYLPAFELFPSCYHLRLPVQARPRPTHIPSYPAWVPGIPSLPTQRPLPLADILGCSYDI